MANMQTEGRFDRAKGRVRSTWGNITDDDIDKAGGNVERLIGIVKEKTGETVDAIRSKLGDLGDDADRQADRGR